MVKLENINKEVTSSVATAIKSFMQKNNLTENELQVTVIDPMSKVIIRVFNFDMERAKYASSTIYHGDLFDVFTYTIITRTSGILEYDDVLSDEYKFKCSE